MADGLHAAILDAAHAAVAALDVADLFTAPPLTARKQVIESDADKVRPVQVVFIGDLQEGPGPYADSGGKSREFPVFWVVKDSASPNAANLTKYPTLRQRVYDLFDGKALAGVAEVQDCEVEARIILNQAMEFFQDVRSVLVLKFKTYEPR